MEPRRLSMHHGSSKYFFYSNIKRLLKILATRFTQEQEQNGREREEWEKSGRDLGIVIVN
jgi:hypothetical protein